MPRLLFVLGCFALSSVSYAATTDAFQKLTPLTIPKIIVPTLVSVPFSFGFESNAAALRKVGDTSDVFVPFVYNTVRVEGPSFSTTAGGADASQLTDGKIDSYFDLPFQAGENSITIELATKPQKIVTASGVQLIYAEFSSRPTEAEVEVVRDGTAKTVRARSAGVPDIIHFPEEYADVWRVTLWYDQPIRISEAMLVPILGGIRTDGITFLAEPGARYELFTNPDRSVYVQTSESPNLSGEARVKGSAGPSSQNQTFIPADTDADGVVEVQDNCRSVANPLQEDVDGNGVGDACDDFDRDGYATIHDNCPFITNRDQRDTDGDKIGDVCDDGESRVTEQYPWLPWMGIGLVVLVLLAMTTLMMRQSVPPQPTA